MQMDVDWQNLMADLIVVEGTANLAGRIDVLEKSSPLLVDSGSSVQLIHGKAGLPTLEQLNDRISVTDPILVDYSLGKRSAGGEPGEILEVIASYNLLHPDLNQNQINVLAELHRSQNNEAIGEVVLDVGRETEIENLRYNLDSFGNEIVGTVLQTSALANLEFASSLPDCAQATNSYHIGDADVAPGMCIWTAPELRQHKRWRSWPQRGYSEVSPGFSAGARFKPDDLGFHVDLAGDIDVSETAMQNFAFADGARWQLAAGVGAELGKVGFSLVASASESRHEILRRLPDSSAEPNSKGTQSTKTVGALATISGEFEFGSWSISPSLQAGLIKVSGNPYSESGGGDLSLSVAAIEKTIAFLRPGIAVELAKTSMADLNVVPHLEIALAHSNNGSFVTNNKFKGGSESFESETSLLGAEIEMSLGANFSSRSSNFFGQVGMSVAFASTGISNLKVGGGSFTFMF